MTLNDIERRLSELEGNAEDVSDLSGEELYIEMMDYVYDIGDVTEERYERVVEEWERRQRGDE